MSKPDLNDVKAGKYRLIAKQWDQILSKPGQPFDFKRHRRGAVIELDIEDARRLVSARAVVLESEYAAHQAAVEAASKPPVLDPAGLATLRETLGLDADADQAQILAAIEDLATKPPADTKPEQTAGIAAIEEYVGDDKARAAEYLAGELARGEAQRSTLVEKLKAIAEA